MQCADAAGDERALATATGHNENGNDVDDYDDGVDDDDNDDKDYDGHDGHDDDGDEDGGCIGVDYDT